MSYRIRIVGRIDGIAAANDGTWLVSCDVDGNDGHGIIKTTLVSRDARQFETPGQAMEYWRRVSTTHPVRRDGKPNRPLTAYTVEITQGKGGTHASPIVGNTIN